MFEIEIDRDACDGIFACLTRDERFIEDDDGLATVDPNAAGVVSVSRDGDRVVATVDGDIDDANLAAKACPPNAIVIREAET